jgi:hypothetical protein
MTDTEMLDWLEAITMKGDCPALLNDDNGHWAVAFDGMQSVSLEDGPADTATSFIVYKESWKNSIREAIIAAADEYRPH